MNERNWSLGNESIERLLLKLSAPATVGMVVMGLYNVADTIFVGRALGPESVQGIAGISICFPIMMLIMAVSLAIGIGGASIISRRLGAEDHRSAERTFGNVVSIGLVLSILVTVLGSIYIVPVLRIFGATETILPYAFDYLSIILMGTIFVIFAQSANNVVRAEGNAKVAMMTMLLSAGLNIVLDPIFIFGLDMGIRGAAIATVIAQLVGALYLIRYFLSGDSTLSLRPLDMIPDLAIVKEIMAIGAAPFSRNASGSALVVILNNILAVYGGDVSIAVYGIFNRLFMFTLMPIVGLVQGMQPILGFNYGAHNLDRVKETLRISVGVSTVISLGGFILLFFFPSQLFSLFTTDRELIESGAAATRIMALAMPLIGFQFVGGSMYQALGKARPSLILSLARQMFLLPLVLVLPGYFGLMGIWIAFPLSDTLAFALTVYMFMREYRRFQQQAVQKDVGRSV